MITPIPHAKGFDSTLALLKEGYLFAANRCRWLKSDIFQTRLMLNPVIFLSGKDEVELFYDNTHFERKRAAPKFIQKTLTGERGVQSLDDEAHKHRKAMFMALMTAENIEHFMQLFDKEWRNSLHKWKTKETITLFSEVQEILCSTACSWAGVPLNETEARQRAKDMGYMVDGFGSIGLRNLHGRLARKRSENWIKGIIEQVRSKQQAAQENTILHTMVWHKELDGNLMDTQVVAVEILNIIRPIVAIATYITFTALALNTYSKYKRIIKEGDETDSLAFVQEVRRFYPFTPFVGARVREAFDWRGYNFPKGRRVILNVYGIDHDARLWESPEEFQAERFKQRSENKFDFIPQGGGNYNIGHRCAGEWLTINTMQAALKLLVKHMSYDVPAQDFSFPLSRIPTLPKSGFIMNNIKEIGDTELV